MGLEYVLSEQQQEDKQPALCQCTHTKLTNSKSFPFHYSSSDHLVATACFDIQAELLLFEVPCLVVYVLPLHSACSYQR